MIREWFFDLLVSILVFFVRAILLVIPILAQIDLYFGKKKSDDLDVDYYHWSIE